MNPYVIEILIVVAAATVSALITRVAVKQRATGTNGEAVLEKIGTGITYAQSVASAVTPFLPQPAGPVISKVLGVAQKAVQHVEATYKAALSTDANAADTRKTEATSLIKSALALDGIADTPEVDKLIDVVIPLLVLALPETHTTTVESGAVASGTTGAV
jgi:hypothetical protein